MNAVKTWTDPITKEVKLVGIGTRGTDLPEFRAAVELLSSRRYPFDEIPRRTADLEHLPALLEIMAGESHEVPPPFAALVVDGPA